jgi:hypothetical protein
MEEICTEALSWPQKRAFLIVPEQTKADMERRFLEVRRSLKGAPPFESQHGEALGIRLSPSEQALMLVDVVSFHRLRIAFFPISADYQAMFLIPRQPVF